MVVLGAYPVFAHDDALRQVGEVRRGSLHEQQEALRVLPAQRHHIRQKVAPHDLPGPAVYPEHLMEETRRKRSISVKVGGGGVLGQLGWGRSGWGTGRAGGPRVRGGGGG